MTNPTFQPNPSSKPIIPFRGQIILTGQVPYSQEAEEAVIGAVLISPDAFYNVAEFLDADDFYILRHAYIWDALIALEARSETIDYLTVQVELENRARLAEIGGPAYLTQLINSVPTSYHAEVYGRLVERAAIRRRFLLAADEIKSAALDLELTIEQVTNEAEQRVFNVSDRHKQSLNSNDDTLHAVLERYWTHVETLVDAERGLGIPSGLNTVDELLGGFRRKEIAVLAGPPGLGKTSFLTTVAINAARLGARVVFFSAEMTADDISGRFISGETGIPSQLLKTGPLTRHMFERFIEASARLAELPIDLIDEFRSPTPLQLQRRLRRLARTRPIDLVICDGLYRMTSQRKGKDEQRNMDLKYVMEDLDTLVRQFNVPLFITHQFNRGTGSGKDKRPKMQDLKDSSAVEEIAQVILGMYRPSYYKQTSLRDDTELIVLKNREGDYGTVKLKYSKSFSKYSDGDK